MATKQFKNLIETFNQSYHQIMNSNQPILHKTELGIDLCYQTFHQMNELLVKLKFNNEDEEIFFFKHIKPVPDATLNYLVHVQKFEIEKPKTHNQIITKYINTSIKNLNLFLSTYSYFTHYMEQNQTHLDHLLFTRKSARKIIPNLTNHNLIPKSFETTHQILWGRIKGAMMMSEYLKNCAVTINRFNQTHHNPGRNLTLHWTASKTDLIEIIYALFSNGAFNHGKADINTITSAFEYLGNIKLENVYKTYSEIKARKNSQTKFLDQLTFSLQQKISREDGLPINQA
jgi:hypothetical protein